MDTSPQTEKLISALRAAYAAFNRGDLDAAVELLNAQIEWSEPSEFPGGGTYHGRLQSNIFSNHGPPGPK
jgi:ketosteroid isomerase-like protein